MYVRRRRRKRKADTQTRYSTLGVGKGRAKLYPVHLPTRRKTPADFLLPLQVKRRVTGHPPLKKRGRLVAKVCRILPDKPYGRKQGGVRQREPRLVRRVKQKNDGLPNQVLQTGQLLCSPADLKSAGALPMSRKVARTLSAYCRNRRSYSGVTR